VIRYAQRDESLVNGEEEVVNKCLMFRGGLMVVIYLLLHRTPRADMMKLANSHPLGIFGVALFQQVS
jgi:hypothetical protein